MSADNAFIDSIAPATAHRVYRLLHDIYILLDAGDRKLLREYDLTSSQYTLLTLLASGEGQRLTTLSDRLLVARSTITRLIAQMEASGLVHRVDDPEDRRAQRVALTPAGFDLLRHASDAHEESLKKRISELSKSEQEMLADLLHKLRSNLQSDLGIADIDV